MNANIARQSSVAQIGRLNEETKKTTLGCNGVIQHRIREKHGEFCYTRIFVGSCASNAANDNILFVDVFFVVYSLY